MKGCGATNNKGPSGISVGSGSVVTDCAATSNTSSAAASAGIRTDSGRTVIDCTSSSNTSSVVATPTTGMGFDLGGGSMIRGCVAYRNKGDGIRIADNGTARDNQCTSNGNYEGGVGTGAGIYAAGSDIRIEANNVTDNDRGGPLPLAI